MAENTDRTEIDSVIELARSAAVESTFIDGSEHVLEVILPPDHEHKVVDLEKYQDQPRRKREVVELHDADSFGAYVVRHRIEDSTTLYADLDRHQVIAVVNDSAKEEPGWGDHRAHLKLKHTKPWLHWTGEDGDSMTQQEFAEHIEKGLAEIIKPDPAEMYELAQTFQATLGASFRQTGRLADGRRGIHFEEQIDAKAGEQGDLEIPKEFHLRVAPFEGGPAHELVARLRFRVREAKLTLSYHLVRPEEVLKAAFDETVGAIESSTLITAFRGTPPVRPGA